MPDITPAELEVLIERLQRFVDEGVEEAYKAGEKYIEQAYSAGWDKGKSDIDAGGFGPFNVPPDEEALNFLDGYQFDLINGLGEDIKKDIGRVVRDAVTNGWSMQRAAKELRSVLDAKKWRINTIARTEVMRAANMGRLNAYKKSGVVKGKEWVTAWDDRTCPRCSDCDGHRTLLDQAFDCGVMAPPLHPNCRCTIVPIFIDEDVELSKPTNSTELLEDDTALYKFKKEQELHLGHLESSYSAMIRRAFQRALTKAIEEFRRYYR